MKPQKKSRKSHNRKPVLHTIDHSSNSSFEGDKSNVEGGVLSQQIGTHKNLKKVCEARRSSSESNSSSQGNGTGKSDLFLSADLIVKLRRYSATWFRQTAGQHPEYFIDTKQYAHFERIRDHSSRSRRSKSKSNNVSSFTSPNLSTAKILDREVEYGSEDDESKSNFQRFPPIQPLIGFNNFVGFCGEEQMISGASGDRFFCHIDMSGEAVDEHTYFDMRAQLVAC
uniref:Uncharacterized protein n=1 Tax=Ditylenchus dipsaci TaxID=166011 RepID=A0A915DM07_9BILA